MKGLKRIYPFLFVVLMLGLATGNTGCKKKKELAAAEAAAAAQLAEDIAEAKKILQAIIDDPSLDNIDQNTANLEKVKAMNLEDTAVLSMIIEAQEKLNNDREKLAAQLEAERLEAERLEAERLAAENAANKNYDLLNAQFEALTGETDYQKSNTIIDNLMPLFSSKDTPVLVIVSEENGMKDYDRPTTIDKYLNYLKDRKAYKAVVENIVYDDNGKIKELELRKK